MKRLTSTVSRVTNVTGYELEIVIPAPLQPLERGERFDLPLCDLFDEIGGDIVGSGTSVREGAIAECIIEVIVTDLDKALPGIIKILSEGEAPLGTTIYLKPQRKRIYPP